MLHRDRDIFLRQRDRLAAEVDELRARLFRVENSVPDIRPVLARAWDDGYTAHGNLSWRGSNPYRDDPPAAPDTESERPHVFVARRGENSDRCITCGKGHFDLAHLTPRQTNDSGVDDD